MREGGGQEGERERRWDEQREGEREGESIPSYVSTTQPVAQVEAHLRLLIIAIARAVMFLW